MPKKILVVNPPNYSIMPIFESESASIAPYAITTDLRNNGYNAQIFDFLEERNALDGWRDSRIVRVAECGNFENERISKQVLYVGRNEIYYEEFLRQFNPDEVWVTCLFTYNWMAAKFVVDITRKINKDIYIKLGGVYPTLCYEHAVANCGADEVVVADPSDPVRFVNVDIGLYRNIPRIFPIITSLGCPLGCNWCAVGLLEGKRMQFNDPEKVLDDIEYKSSLGVKKFRFTDSNILQDYDNHFKIILEGIIKRGIKSVFNVYGGVNPIFIDQDILELMAEAGFVDVQVPIESIDDEVLKSGNRKITVKDWATAVDRIKKISQFSLSSYILCGMPGQKITDIYKALIFVRDHGVIPAPLFFTPIPKTIYEDKNIPLEDCHPYLFPYASNVMKVSDLDQIQSSYCRSGVYASNYITGNIYKSSGPIPIPKGELNDTV